MATTIGNKVLHTVLSKAAYTSLDQKNADTLYFVGDSTGIQLYKGSTPVGGGFKVLSSEPENTTGMAEGVLYLAPSGSMYYNANGTLTKAMEFVKTASLPDKNAAGNDGKVASIAAIYTAINNEIAAYMSGTFHSHILAPVADITALKAVTGMQDKDVIFVESVNALFSYDAESTATDNSSSTAADQVPTVVAPTSGTGRWLRTQSQFKYNSSDFTWTEANGLALSATKLASIMGDVDTKISTHNSANDAHSTLFGNKLDKPTAAGTDGQYLTWDNTASKPKWSTLTIPAGVNVVATTPTVTAADNGKVYYVQANNTIYEVVSGALVEKIYSKANTDTAISTAVTNHNADSNTTAHAGLFAGKADLNDVKWTVVE